MQKCQETEIENDKKVNAYAFSSLILFILINCVSNAMRSASDNDKYLQQLMRSIVCSVLCQAFVNQFWATKTATNGRNKTMN